VGVFGGFGVGVDGVGEYGGGSYPPLLSIKPCSLGFSMAAPKAALAKARTTKNDLILNHKLTGVNFQLDCSLLSQSPRSDSEEP
jgi:hypothetical protein